MDISALPPFHTGHCHFGLIIFKQIMILMPARLYLVWNYDRKLAYWYSVDEIIKIIAPVQ
jgi:hypothetical protein